MEEKQVIDMHNKLQAVTIGVLMQRLQVNEIFINQVDLEAVGRFIGSNKSQIDFEVCDEGQGLLVRLSPAG